MSVGQPVKRGANVVLIGVLSVGIIFAVIYVLQVSRDNRIPRRPLSSALPQKPGMKEKEQATRRPVEKNLPELSQVKYVRGRSATRADLESGAAAFVQQDKSGRNLGMPSPDITVPQYATHIDDNGTKQPGIVIQAEVSKQLGTEVIGMRLSDGTCVAGLRREFVLLGPKKPH